jgi:ABC-type glutathione transport system ATPase component
MCSDTVRAPEAEAPALVALQGVTKRFRTPVSDVLAVDDVSIGLRAGGALGIIGESGSGKSTLGRIAVGLLEPDEGEVVTAGLDLSRLDRAGRRQLRSSVSIVFQEPFASLDPRRTVLDSVLEPLEVKVPGRAAAARRRAEALAALERVGLGAEYARRYPKMLSGGQQQRVGIARAIVTRPAVVLLDEPTSALDRSIRADVLALLRDLRESEGLAYLVITHDVETVEALSDDIIVMYRGRVVEQGRAVDVLAAPEHPYTRALLAARLSVDPRDQLSPLPPVPDGGF